MYASVGDRLIVRSNRVGGPVRDGEVLQVRHSDGSPPYVVRWSDNGHESVFFPGPDTEVHHVAPGLAPDPGDDAG
ncbi:DUF1918 domain-containing protein [Nocardioides nitrophenolicus]|uniref:DUF1918 domain-containing protein n=1 Tax=Nocardioides nitrophenolicus TaxID=60489 RepID=UPI001958BBC2|nr:DUF1918 domain-containing protein [Nocardioides nitrophenolicus]MBM7515666.1 hypothetical protein [Nocardioides nitrophenolicus]